MPSYLLDAELSDETIGRALSSPLFTQEREEPAGRRQAYHFFEESLLPSQSLSVCHVRRERCVHELSSLGSRSREKPSRDSENEQIRILLERQEQILVDCRAEIHKHEFQADFANPHASSSAPYPQELNPWETTIEEPLHMSTAEKSERPEQNRDLRCQSGPSAKDSFDPSEGRFSKNYGSDQQRLQTSDLHFAKFTNPTTFACWKIRFKTEVCTCSHFPTEAMVWIKEVEMVESVDDLNLRVLSEEFKHQILRSSTRGLLQHWTESSTILTSKEESVWRNRKPKKRTAFSEEDRSLTWSTSTSWSLEPMILSGITPTYLQLFFEMTMFKSSIRNGTKFYYLWRKFPLMTSWKDCTN